MQATLLFTLPDEAPEFRYATDGGALGAAVQDLEAELRRRDKYGKPAERKLTAGQVRLLLREYLTNHEILWVLD